MSRDVADDLGQLREEAASYKRFLAAGGSKGSLAGRERRERISTLVVSIEEARFRDHRITEDDELKALAAVDVFG